MLIKFEKIHKTFGISNELIDFICCGNQLHKSAFQGKTNEIEDLFSKGLININQVNDFKQNINHIAVIAKQKNIIEKWGFGLTENDILGYTPIHLVCGISSDLNILQIIPQNLLLNTFEFNTYGSTPIHNSIRFNKFDIFKYLMKIDNSNEFPIYEIESNPQAKLSKKSLLNPNTFPRRKALHYCSKFDNVRCLKKLIHSGISINCVDSFG
jgi:hypothetical protein